jgi:hypothetical protein
MVFAVAQSTLAMLGGRLGKASDNCGSCDRMRRSAFAVCLDGATVEDLLNLLVIAVGIFAMTITACPADTIDATTSCSVATQAFDSEKRAGQVLAGASSPHVGEVGDYIMDVMEQLDKQFLQDGKSGIWSDFSDKGKHAIAASTVANCRLHPERTIHDAAQAVYSSIRDIHLQLGIVK